MPSNNATTIVLLGSTGSIGTQVLDVVSRHKEDLTVLAIAAGGNNIDLLIRQAVDTGATYIGIAHMPPGMDTATLAQQIADAEKQEGKKPYRREILTGPHAATIIAGLDANSRVVNGMTGSIGLRPTIAALTSGATLVLANKESLVAGGALVADAMIRPGQVIPVDSEHSAIAQALSSGQHEKGLVSPVVTGKSEVEEIILTASGGPFRGKKRAQLQAVTPEQALAHPTWDMGAVVTINSSTLVNKGLELIEAYWLFDIEPQKIVPVIHPQSIVHSAVTFRDGSTIAQLSPPDMRLPLALGLSWPQRMGNVCRAMDFTKMAQLTFEPIDHETFPALELARHAVQASSTHPAVYNAANEECVAAFLDGALSYVAIVDTVSTIVEEHRGIDHPDLDDIDHVEQWARSRAHAVIDQHKN
ncbi:MAG: 1-deoxy-D-xylulose-5-phosphate reductoisomerase [Actinomycetaceae bacterium]|nr:1-deoxy-D-xylulose-5-phosphate reductoisomerase [Actinomycetaceae bacterium]